MGLNVFILLMSEIELKITLGKLNSKFVLAVESYLWLSKKGIARAVIHSEAWLDENVIGGFHHDVDSQISRSDILTSRLKQDGLGFFLLLSSPYLPA